MHRSGTSLLARYLVECGVFMGHTLLRGHSTNPAGHYEDHGFLSLHQDLLKAHELDYKIVSTVLWHIDHSFRDRAISLISERNAYTTWGWKDPRTCLFLDFWKSLLPEACYLICYRPYLPVIESLITRDIIFYKEVTNRLRRLLHPRFTTQEIPIIANEYLRVWIHYNSEILSHVEFPHTRYILLPFEEMIKGKFSRLERLHDMGYIVYPPKNFKTTTSQSVQHLPFDFELDEDLVHTANNLDQRFKELLNIAY